MSGETVMVVEDEAIVAQDIRGRLEGMGYVVSGVAGSAEEAIQRAGPLRPDLVLMDIRLKGRMDGIEAAAAIRADLDIPAIFLTAYTDDETLRRAQQTEPFGYLVKPFQDRELRAAIEIAIFKHRAERALRLSELRFRTLVQLAPDAIVMADPDGTVTVCNRAAEALFGRRQPELCGRRLAELLGAPGDDRGLAALAELDRKGSLHNLEIDLPGPGAEPVPVEASASVMQDHAGARTGYVAIWRDVTERKRAHREMMSRLMAHELEEGTLYLVKEAAPVLSLECFRELLRAGYRGTALSRSPPGAFPLDGAPPFEFRWISRRDREGSLPPDVQTLERWLEGAGRNRAVLLDRLDYLISENGLEAALHFVHRLREMAYLNSHIILLSLDPATLASTELRAFEKETAEVRSRSPKGLPEDLMEVLRFAYEQNGLGIKPTMAELCAELRLSRPTARKRLRNLVRAGHLLLSSRGRAKVVELSEKGRRIFQG